MGSCTGSSPHSKVTVFTLVDQVKKIKFISQQVQLKKQRQLKMQQDLLIEAFGNQVSKRSKITEKAMIGRTVFTKNIIMSNDVDNLVYKYIENQSKRILEGRELMDEWRTIETVMPSINTLVYCTTFLNDETIQKFYYLIKQKYSQYQFPKDSDIRIELIKYHRNTEEVTFEMENTFIMEFCIKYNIQVSKVNGVGHQYRYSAGTISYSQV